MDLPLEVQAQLTQLIAETFLIDRFHQSRPRTPVHFDGSANNLFSQSIQRRQPGSTYYLCPLCALRVCLFHLLLLFSASLRLCGKSSYSRGAGFHYSTFFKMSSRSEERRVGKEC